MESYDFYMAVISGSCFYMALRIGFIHDSLKEIRRILSEKNDK